MKLKFYYLVIVVSLLSGCMGYDKTTKNSIVVKNKIDNPPAKKVDSSNLFSEVTGAFGINLGDTSDSYNTKTGTSFTPDSHPDYMNTFRYFINDDKVIYKISASAKFSAELKEYVSSFKYSSYACKTARKELIEILETTYGKNAIEEVFDFHYSPLKAVKKPIIVTFCNTDAPHIYLYSGSSPYKYDTKFQIIYSNPKLLNEHISKEKVRKKEQDAQDALEAKKLRQLKAQKFGLINSPARVIQIPVATNTKRPPVILKRDVGGKAISIPTPKDWFEVSSEMPRLFKTFEKITLPPNRVLAAFLPIKDKKTPKLNRYTLVLASKDVEKMPDLPSSEFAWLKSQVKKKQGTLVKRFKEKYGDSWSLSDGPSSLKFKIGKVTPIGIFIDKKHAFAQATIMSTEATVGSKSSFRNVVVSAATLWVNGKMLNIQVTSTFKTKEDVDWIKAKTREFVNLILEAN